MVFCSASQYTVSGTHTYHEAGTYQATISAKDDNGPAQAVVNSTATVADAALIPGTVSFGSIPDQTVPYSGRVATFSDGNSFAVASDFSATINWGMAPPAAREPSRPLLAAGFRSMAHTHMRRAARCRCR